MLANTEQTTKQKAQEEEKKVAASAAPEDFAQLADSDILNLLQTDGFLKRSYIPSDLDITNCLGPLLRSSQQTTSHFRVYETLCLAPEYFQGEPISEGYESLQEVFNRIMDFRTIQDDPLVYAPMAENSIPVEVFIPVRDEFGHTLLLKMWLTPFCCQARLVDFFPPPEEAGNDRAQDFEYLKYRIQTAWTKCYREKWQKLGRQDEPTPLYFEAQVHFEESQSLSEHTCVYRVLRSIFSNILVPNSKPSQPPQIHPIGAAQGDDEQAMAYLRAKIASQILINKLGNNAYPLTIDRFGIIRKVHLDEPHAYHAYCAQLAEAELQKETAQLAAEAKRRQAESDLAASRRGPRLKKAKRVTFFDDVDAVELLTSMAASRHHPASKADVQQSGTKKLK